MGVFYYIHSVALFEDLPLEEHYHSPEEFYFAADQAYQQVQSILSSDPPCDSPTSLFLECHQLLDRRLHLRPHACRVGSAVLRQQPRVGQLSYSYHKIQNENYLRNSEIVCL